MLNVFHLTACIRYETKSRLGPDNKHIKYIYGNIDIISCIAKAHQQDKHLQFTQFTQLHSFKFIIVYHSRSVIYWFIPI